MLRPAAVIARASSVADVGDFHVVRNRADQELVHDPVDQAYLAAPVHLPIPMLSVQAALPKPAAGYGINCDLLCKAWGKVADLVGHGYAIL
jgi:hypothetical protein